MQQAADIFDRSVSERVGVITSDAARLTLPTGLGVALQNLQFTYGQMIARIYEVGSDGPNGVSDIYRVVGRARGNLSVNQMVGPSGPMRYFYGAYGKACSTGGTLIQLVPDDAVRVANTNSPTFTLKNTVIISVSVSIASQDLIVTENTNLVYSSLEGYLQAGG